MSKLSKIAMFGTAGLLLAALPATAKPKPAAVQTAVIENSGSTNTTGYKITVTLNGDLARASALGSRDQAGNVQAGNAEASNAAPFKNQVKKFFADLSAAMPLTSLPVRHGMRSASFGTRTTITYKGQQSPDLTFASDPRTAALKADIDAITKTLGVGNAPKRPIIVIHADR